MSCFFSFDFHCSAKVEPKRLHRRSVPVQEIDLRLPAAHIAFHRRRCRPLTLKDEVAKLGVQRIDVLEQVAEQGSGEKVLDPAVFGHIDDWVQAAFGHRLRCLRVSVSI